MDSIPIEEKRKIFRSELVLLKNKEYITDEHFYKTMVAHNKYYADLETAQLIQQDAELVEEPIRQQIPKVKEVVKKKLTAEQIRERNISWLLNIGVIFLLIGGLFVATSNWDTMSNLMKSASIAFVSVLFYGMAYIAQKILKITRTSFAFIVLGSLFLPIFILSIGWFGLFGPYLSFYGEGRFILGAIGSALLLPVYGLFAQKLKSRLFVWFAFITLSSLIGYVLTAIQFEQDSFYLGMMLYNALLVVCFHRFKKHEDLQLFIKELVYFVQANLILSSLLMLLFFNSPVFYSFNIFLTAAIYLSMVYVTGRKEFHFVFTLMIVYGAYQLIEHSSLESFGPILYALIGVGFLAIPKLMDKEYHWEKVFRLTSAVISSLAFLYISVEGILLRLNDPSFVLVIAYFIMAVQFMYLAKMMNNLLFSYLSPIFLATALFEIMSILGKIFEFNHLMFPIFMIGFILFVTCGYLFKHPLIQVISKSSRDVSFVIMLFSLLLNSILLDWFESGLMLLFISLAFLFVRRVEERSIYVLSLPWAIPISIGLAFFTFGEEMRTSFKYYEINLGFTMNALLGSASLFLLSYLWKALQEHDFKKKSYFIAQAFYTIAILAAILLPINEVWMRPLVLFVGVGMFVSLYFVTKHRWLPMLISFITLLCYFSLLNALHLSQMESEIFLWVQLPLGAVLLLVVAYFLYQKQLLQLAKGFSWVAHLYLPISLLLTLVSYWNKAIVSFVIAGIVYWLSSRLAKKEWGIRLFLFGTFLCLYIVMTLGIESLYSRSYTDYAYLLTSIVVAHFWLATNNIDKQRTKYFLIPFSIIGILAFMMNYPFEMFAYVTMLLYIIGLIVFLFIIKSDGLVGIPLLLLFFGTGWFFIVGGLDVAIKPLVAGLFGVTLMICGNVVYKKLITKTEKFIKVDSFSLISFLFFCMMFVLQTEALWTQMLPGIFISLLFYLQRKRILLEYSWIVIILAGISLLQPYYTVLWETNIPELIYIELNVLPIVCVMVFIRFVLKLRFRKITDGLQWIVLIIVSFILIVDGLVSSTINDAILLGTLSLISILAGMYLRIKSYFFVGIGVLLLNVLLQTRPYWGNLPWWAYLLIAGTILIAVASYNEWYKQKSAKGESTLIAKWKNNFLQKMKDWK